MVTTRTHGLSSPRRRTFSQRGKRRVHSLAIAVVASCGSGDLRNILWSPASAVMKGARDASRANPSNGSYRRNNSVPRFRLPKSFPRFLHEDLAELGFLIIYLSSLKTPTQLAPLLKRHKGSRLQVPWWISGQETCCLKGDRAVPSYDPEGSTRYSRHNSVILLAFRISAHPAYKGHCQLSNLQESSGPLM